MDCRLTVDVTGQISGNESATANRASDPHNVTLLFCFFFFLLLFAGDGATCIKSVIVNS